MAGLYLDEWQQEVLIDSLGERSDGRWAAFEVGLVIPRQNGKDAVLEARELAGLFLLGERLLIHSAHQFDTSLEHFRRLLFLIEETPDFDRRVRRVTRSHGEEGIELKGGQRIRFRTRTKGGGRGFSGDLLVLNEAMILSQAAHGALLPTLSARPNPQVWYVGSPVDQHIHEDGLVLSRIRHRGIAAADPGLAYFEWSLPEEIPADVTEARARDPEAWLVANPGLGIRITEEHVDLEHRSMDARTFAVERLGVGDWPNPDGSAAAVIDLEVWESLTDLGSQIVDTFCFAFDVSPDRSSASVAAAGRRSDGVAHLEIVERRRGTGWVVARLAELNERWNPVGVVCDASGPAGSLLYELGQAGVAAVPLKPKEHAQACGLLYDKVAQRTVRHLGTPELAAALRGASRRPLGDAWAWSRKSSAVDISPLVAATLALWGSETIPAIDEPPTPYAIWG
jgi:hypothetical protein